ncbi:D(2) dopamine receptor-like [Liolophura sinensis]|uniref:D(2) dopamine receptor-like n=1 Tax=Liolophura sinensis TaxID=3198878 RepID=UPI0031587561
MVFTCFGIPFASMTVCYILILKEVRDSRRRIGHFDDSPISISGRAKEIAPANDVGNSGKVLNSPTSTLVHPETMHIKISISSAGKSPLGDPKNRLRVTAQADLSGTTRVSTYKQKQAQKRMREQIRLTASLLVVVLIFIVAWLPFCVTMFWSVFGGSNPPPRTLDMFTLLLGYANSCCNPIVYGLINKRFNDAFRKLFKCQYTRMSQIVPTDFATHFQ